MDKEVKSLITKAEQAESADAALKFSQAACNAANALRCLLDAELARKRVD